MPEHLVCLTFDHDNASANIARGLVTPTMISRGDFGIPATERILKLLEKYSIATTWFVPGHTIENYPYCVRSVANAGHEIANHGWTHRIPASLGREGEEEELVRANAAIEALTGRAPRGYRSPAWDLSTHTVDLLLKQGFEYDSSMMGHDYIPYQALSSCVSDPTKCGSMVAISQSRSVPFCHDCTRNSDGLSSAKMG